MRDWMVFARAAVGPVDIGPFERTQILDLQQYSGRDARIILVEGGLEAERPRRRQQGGEHRERPAVEIEAKEAQPPRGEGVRDDLAEESFGGRVCGHRRARFPLPAGGLEREEVRAPGLDLVRRT